MAINFPSDPTNNQLHTVGDTTWRYVTAKTAWVIHSTPTVTGGSGSATIDFGDEPGSNEASVTVVGQTGILASTSKVHAFIMADDTSSDHTASDHKYVAMFLGLSCGDIINDTGFTIYARSMHKLSGTWTVRFIWTY